MKRAHHIVVNPTIHHGKPVIGGTRVPVSTVVGSLAGGMTFQQIEREYDLTRDDIKAAFAVRTRARWLIELTAFHRGLAGLVH
jgi:uncharacterized protein (DUF433 family)